MGVAVGQLELGAPARAALPSVSAHLFPATREHAGAVVVGELDVQRRADLEDRALRRRPPGCLPRSAANQDLLDSWVGMLAPHFDADGSVNLTGTYSDGYGYSNGLMLVRNVMRDFRRALNHERPGDTAPCCIGVEQHRTHRAILHFHAMIGGEWSTDDMGSLKAYWDLTRGWSVAKPVSELGGCVAYCAKHLLKRGAADHFEFWLPPRVYGSRYERRHSRGSQAL